MDCVANSRDSVLLDKTTTGTAHIAGAPTQVEKQTPTLFFSIHADTKLCSVCALGFIPYDDLGENEEIDE
jgi:hypothetical protein